MPTPSLKEFTEPVPVCGKTCSLAAVLEIFRSSRCDTIVVVNEQQRPLGVVNLRQVMPYLISSPRLGESTEVMHNHPDSLQATGDFHKPLSQLDPPIIEPLTILPAQLSLSQFWPYLQQSDDRLPQNREQEMGKRLRRSQSKVQQTPGLRLEEAVQVGQLNVQSSPLQAYWALVDEDEKFLGLLNSWSILQSLAPDFPTTNAAEGSMEPPPMGLRSLVQLLEQLPIPLSLQTATGQVLAENLTWRQEIGKSPDWNWVRSTTAAMLDFPSASASSALRTEDTHSESLFDGSSMPLTRKAQLSAPVESAFAIRNAAHPWAATSTQAAVQHYCAIDTPCMAAAVSRGRVTSSASPTSKTQDAEVSWEASKLTTDTRKQTQERVFSFVEVPLSPSMILQERDWGLRGGSYQSNMAVDSSQLSSPNLWLVMAQDTTEQQQVAKELAAKNADLVQLNRLKDEFLACISHELRTPLTAVLGLSTLLKDQVLGQLNERQARYARLIYQSGRQLMTVVNDILDLTRMETGQLELTLEPVQIQLVCDRAYSQAQQVLQEKDLNQEEPSPQIEFTLEIEPGLEMLVADELRLRQMLAHLLSNALKFTDVGGEIGLRVNRWEGWIAFTVWDTGIGIPPEKQHLIFQKFQQLENPLTRRFEGTGLGLVLTQRLAHLHGGDISFISKISEGSQFTLLLPSCPPQGRGQESKVESGKVDGDAFGVTSASLSNQSFNLQPANPQPATQTNRNRLVLIVETVPQYLEGLTEQLKSLGYRSVIARSGTDAIKKARSLQPCAVLLNPLLPQLSGWDVLTLLKSDDQTCHIPVLVTTTQAEKQQAYHQNADGFLSLPVQKQALLESLNRLCKPKNPSSSSLTILHLSPDLVETNCQSSVLSSELTEVLNLQQSEFNYRVLEADDLDQAELLVRVWHPDVILLSGAGIADPLTYLKELSVHSGLASLPLITLEHQTTEAANQITGLSVYPCLAPDSPQKMASLLQVIQVAAGMSRKPNILMMDIVKQGKRWQLGRLNIEGSTLQSSTPTQPHTPWLQALSQYLQTAGFRSSLSCSWSEVYRQLQEESVDLLIIRLTDISDTSVLTKGLIPLNQLPKLPPILVLDHRLDAQHLDKVVANGATSTPNLESLLRAVATQILRGPSPSMSQLLDQINQTLAHSWVMERAS
jgi:signal transduction histidine kinase/DNA-binding NarL/FixJ family response regulator